MAEARGIAAAGNWIIDHVKIIDRLPEEERLAIIFSEERGTGGAPYNVLAGLAKLDPDLPLQAIGMVGEDDNGSFILNHLDQLGIDRSQMRETPEAPTSYTDVMTVRSTGRRTFFHNYGANALLDLKHFQLDRIRARILHLGYLMLLNALDAPDPDHPERTCAARLLQEARQQGLLTSIDIVTDLSPRLHTVVRPALPHVDFFITNELEAAAVAQVSIRDDDGKLLADRLPEIADALFGQGVQKLVVIHAPEAGYWKHRNGEEFFQPSLRLPEGWIKGSAGAGDAFCAGILYGLHEDWSAEQCLKLASANAAQSLTHATCTARIRPLSETMALVERFGFRSD